MASKNVYFFQLNLFQHGEEIDHQCFKTVLQEVVEKHATTFDDYESLDVTPYEEEMHLILDIYDYNDSSFFVRMSKQKPSNSMVQHNYRTHEKEDVLPDNDEREKGIEQYTYGYLNYQQGIFSFVSTLGAPNEKAISNILKLYAPEYSMELTAIPNAMAIESIYEREESEITKLEIEVPLPDAGTLENVFQWNENEILEVLNERHLRAEIVIKPLRKQSITYTQEETRKIMDAIRAHLPGYTKAKMKAKARNIKLRDFNFFEDKFSYPIDIQNSYIRDGERIYYTVEELVNIYRARMRAAYHENEALLITIVGDNRGRQ